MKDSADKPRLRKAVRQRLSAMGTDAFAARSKEALARLTRLDVFKAAENFAGYRSLPQEVDTTLLLESRWVHGQRICVPRWRTEEDAYAWCWADPYTLWHAGPQGVMEPVEHAPVVLSELALAIVPAMAVDRTGTRLGHGGGQYDRLLAGVCAPIVALIYECQRVEEIPSAPHDVPVDLVVTEEGVYGATRRGRMLLEAEEHFEENET